MAKNKNIEILSEDMLDDDFMDIFKPIFFLQRVFGFLGMSIEYRFATAPSSLYQLYSTTIWIIEIICVFDCVLTCETKFDHMSTDSPVKLGLLISGCTNALLAWRKSFLTGNLNSQIYVKLQKIDRNITMKNRRYLNKKLFTMSITTTIIASFLFLLWLVALNTILVKEFCPPMTLTVIACVPNFVEMFLALVIIYFITYRVEYINKILLQKNAKKAKHFFGASKVYCMANMANAVDVSCEKVSDELVLGIYCILDSFEAVMDLFQYPIFFFTCQMMAWHLITMQNLVISFKKEMTVDVPSYLCTVPASLTILVLMLVLCLASNALTSKLDTTRIICTNILSSLNEGKSRYNAKRVLLLLNGRRDASVFNIYTLDARLPLRLLGITASYTIVLLQFAML